MHVFHIKNIGLIILWIALAGHAIAGLPGGNGEPGDSPGTLTPDEDIQDGLEQLMRTWPAQAMNETGNSVQLSAPQYADEEYREAFQAINPEMHMAFNPHVKTYIQFYTLARYKEFETVLNLASYYLPYFEQELAARKMPAELKYLPMALSALNPRAVGQDGSAGIWRLHYHTALRYGLTCTRLQDDRRDLRLSTRAALDYLKTLKAQFGSWNTAIAAYVCGPAGLKKAVMRSEVSRDFWQVYEYLPQGPRDILPAFHAATYIAQNKRKHFFKERNCPLPFETESLKLEEDASFKAISEFTKISEMKLRDLNPIHRAEIIPKGSPLIVPMGLGSMVYAYLDTIYATSKAPEIKQANLPTVDSNPSGEKPAVKITPIPPKAAKPVIPDNSVQLAYTIKSGDNLGAISEWYDVSLSDLKAWNGIKGHMIRAGDKLKVYVPNEKKSKLAQIDKLSFDEKQALIGKSKPKEKEPIQSPSPGKSAETGNFEMYTVKSGDNLWIIAKKYPGISADDIMKINGIDTNIKPGQKLKIRKK